jgi:transcriptional regulator with XRE-family HTH domain
MQKTIHSPIHQIFCSLLRNERTKAGLSQASLAEKLGKPQSFIAKVEKGERRVDLIEFLTIAETIGFSPAGFIRKLKNNSPS